jgi:hypothetical protein
MLFLNAEFQQWKRRLENIKKQDPVTPHFEQFEGIGRLP